MTLARDPTPNPLDPQITSPTVIAKVLDGEPETADLDPIQGLQHRKRERLLRRREVGG